MASAVRLRGLSPAGSRLWGRVCLQGVLTRSYGPPSLESSPEVHATTMPQHPDCLSTHSWHPCCLGTQLVLLGCKLPCTHW